MGPEFIQRSLDIVREYRYRFSNEQVALAINERVIETMPRIGEVFSEGLAAKKFLPTRNGRYKEVPDVAMRLKTVETIKSLQDVAQPRGPLIQNNTQFNQNNVNAPGYQPGMSFEARLRAVRERRGLKNEEDVVILDAAEVDDDQTLSEEMEGLGIDMDEEEEDEDGSDEA